MAVGSRRSVAFSFATRLRLAGRMLLGDVQPAAAAAVGFAPSFLRAGLEDTLQEFLADDALGNMSAAWVGAPRTRDRPWPARREDLSSALAAWRTNPLARRIVNLTRDHVWGRGIRPISKNKIVQKWLDKFWDHELNYMDERIPTWIDAITLDGEVFPTFHFSAVDGMTFLRALPAIQIKELHWRANDYEQLTEFGQEAPGQVELIWWPSVTLAPVETSSMGHYAVNRILGAVRGSGDLDPALPWLAYYSDWLEDRVERNAVLSKFYYEVTVENASDVADAQKRYASPPADGTVVVHSAAEKHDIKKPQVGADDAKDDGQALRMMVAVGGNVPTHWLADPGTGNSEATSSNMNDVSYRHYATRQAFIRRRIISVCRLAYGRAAANGAVRHFLDPQIDASVSDISSEDNQRLADAARGIAEAFAKFIEAGLDTDKRLVGLIYRFAGESLDEQEIADIVAKAERRNLTPGPSPTGRGETSPPATSPPAPLPQGEGGG